MALLEPSGVVTVTSRGPAGASREMITAAVIWLSLSTVVFATWTPVPPTATDAPSLKFAPVSVSFTCAPGSADAGAIQTIAGFSGDGGLGGFTAAAARQPGFCPSPA